MTHRDAVQLVARLASALHCAHEKGIIHRDIKPENIMLDEAGEPHIMDFGLARRAASGSLRTQEDVRMGTPAYMSPEQAIGQSRAADARSDLWSLGVILYELLTGRRPFEGDALQVLRAIADQNPSPPRKLNKRVDRDLETICLTCLEKDSRKRYQSCRELADELKRWLEGQPIKARRMSLLERSGRWIRRNPAVVSASVAAAILAAVLVARPPIETQTGDPAGASRSREPEAPRNEITAVGHFQGHTDKIRAVAFSPDGDYLLSGSDDRTLRLWDLNTMQVVGIVGRHAEVVTDVAFLPDGVTAVSSSDDHTVRLWDVEERKEVGRFEGHDGVVVSVDVSADGQWLVSCGFGPTVWLRNLEDSDLSKQLIGAPSHLESVAITPDGTRVVSAGHKGSTIIVWDAASGRQIHRLRAETLFPNVAISSDGGQLLSGGDIVQLWDLATGQELKRFGGEAFAEGLAFLPNGKFAVVVHKNGTLKVWDLIEGTEVFRKGIGNDMIWRQVAVSPDGHFAACEGPGLNLWLWRLPETLFRAD